MNISDNILLVKINSYGKLEDYLDKPPHRLG